MEFRGRRREVGRKGQGTEKRNKLHYICHPLPKMNANIISYKHVLIGEKRTKQTKNPNILQINASRIINIYYIYLFVHKNIFSFIRSCLTVLQSGYTSLHFQTQRARIPVIAYPSHHLVLSVLWIFKHSNTYIMIFQSCYNLHFTD